MSILSSIKKALLSNPHSSQDSKYKVYWYGHEKGPLI
jgi:hypothetical protein